MADVAADTIDRLLAGELSPSDQRRLAQSALDDPDLFDQLTAAAAAQSALRGHDPQGVAFEEPARSAAQRRWWPVLAGGALAAAAVVLLSVAYPRLIRRETPPLRSPEVSQAPITIETPILLTARAQTLPDQTFRSDQDPVRLPKPAGVIVAVRDGVVDIDLGSLDGLRQGVDVQVLRESSGAAAGRITITTVFRERSRGRPIDGGEARVGDRVEAGAAVHVKAILEQAAARQSASDAAGARALVELAVSRTASPGVPSDLRRQALAQLGAFEHQSGDLTAAERTLSLAAEEFEKTPVASAAERADLLNELGAIQFEQRKYPAAEQTLRAAEPYAAGATKMRVTNNLGALAALRGDRAAAESLYRQARSLAGDLPELAADRTSIEKNLSALGTNP